MIAVVASARSLSCPMSRSPAFCALVEDAKRRIREMTVHEVRRRDQDGENFHLVDVREESEFARDRLAGATHLARGIIERDIDDWIPERDALIVLYCGGGNRSALAVDNLQKMGFQNVWSMEGGIRAWRAAGYPVT
jgi:rhodanese-related sulfurtransferase